MRSLLICEIDFNQTFWCLYISVLPSKFFETSFVLQFKRENIVAGTLFTRFRVRAIFVVKTFFQIPIVPTATVCRLRAKETVLGNNNSAASMVLSLQGPLHFTFADHRHVLSSDLVCYSTRNSTLSPDDFALRCLDTVFFWTITSIFNQFFNSLPIIGSI